MYVTPLCMHMPWWYACLLILPMLSACHHNNDAYSLSYPKGKQYATEIETMLKTAKCADDSLILLTQAISGYCDDGINGHIDNGLWRKYSFEKKLHLCATDSVKLLCSSSADLLIDAIHNFTPWRAYAYSYGAGPNLLAHVCVLVDIRGKLAHADPYFGHVMYDAAADTLMDFYNEIELLKQGWLGKLKRKQLNYSNDMLICDDSVSISGYVDDIGRAIGVHQDNIPAIEHSTGICPYKVKIQMTMDKWAKLERGGKPYVEWLSYKGYKSIDYLVLFPIDVYSSPSYMGETFAQYLKRTLLMLTQQKRP